MEPLCGIVVPWNDETPAYQILNKPKDTDVIPLVLEGTDEEAINVQKTLLLRPSSIVPSGIYIYHLPTEKRHPNRRATRLSFAAGLFDYRFYNTTVIIIPAKDGLDSIQSVLEGSVDLRPDIQRHFGSPSKIPKWMTLASKENYLDRAVLKRLAQVMSESTPINDDDDEEEDDDEEDSSISANNAPNPSRSSIAEKAGDSSKTRRECVSKQPLCLHCRRPTTTLCADCQGAYFCDAPRTCRQDCWSHDCVCATWRLYTERRATLGVFPFGPWHQTLTSRTCQLSDEAYRNFLKELGVTQEGSPSWWGTELGGWAGGSGEGSKRVDWTHRMSYAEGFAPLPAHDYPQALESDESRLANIRDELGLIHLKSWDEYYRLRRIPLDSPAALLLTFPMTLHYMITTYGQVPCTVAKMLQRPLRIHIVGAEKELQMLDLFREVTLLSNIHMHITFVVRHDMIPERMQGSITNEFSLDLSEKLSLSIVAGSYGESIDPMFDVQPPDMVVAFNAGLFAYESWRYPIEFLYSHPSVVGVFSDYNEWSGVQCAGLAGNYDTLCVNPFRQPLAMPVYSMNLPQFSNGFLYVFNEQDVD